MSDNNNHTETVTDISAEIRRRWDEASEAYDYGIIEPSEIIGWADRLDAAQKRESEVIERIVRDAIISYLEWFPSVPNDDAEAELKQRAETANAWLVSHGFKPEELTWSKEEFCPF